ncbi:MAG: amidase [Planktomarina sp.]
MTKSDLWKLGVADIVAATRSGERSVTDIVEAAIDRMDQVNPALNAVVMDLSNEARQRAAALDRARASGAALGPLHGVPVTIKVNVDQTGWATTNGVTALANLVAASDAPVVRNLQNAGAVVIGRTNTPEFSFRAETDNELHGRTRNPWGDHISPGGSSGGAGAAVMAGIGALGHGNDIGGSLRFPAAANGAVTLKPGLGRVPAWNPSQTAERGLLAQSMSVQGLLARSPQDLDLAMPALIAPDVRDPFHVPLSYHGAATPPKRVALCKDTPGFKTHPDVLAALEAAADALSDAGYEVEQTAPPLLQETAMVGYRALLGEVKALMGPDIETYGSDTLQQIFAEYHEQFAPYEGVELLKMMAQRSHYAREWALFLQEYPLVLCPFLPQPFFTPARDTEGADGVREALGSALWSYSMNYVGLPAGCLPTRLAHSEQGPRPINVQIIGQRWREDKIVEAMIAVEARLGTLAGELWARMD